MSSRGGDDSLVACLTPAGTGAIATLAVRGPRAWTVVSALFRPTAKIEWPPEELSAGSFWPGTLGAGGMKDRVVLAILETEPVPWIEVHCHGGLQVVRWLFQTLEEKGIHVCSWQEFLTVTSGC